MMIAEVSWPTLGAAFAAGLAGSAHCLTMCGGVAGALGMRARSAAATSLQSWLQPGLHQCGRIAGYALAGTLVGMLSQGTQWFMHMTSAAVVLRVAAGVLTLLIALRVLTGRNLLASIERSGMHVWRRLQPFTHRAARSDAWYGSLLLGLLWGWLPCGMVYSMLLMAATTGNVAAGAATMASFGCGTLPAMLASSWVISRLPWSANRATLRLASGMLLVLFGLWSLVAPLLPAGQVHVH
jgi:uncharacterized protein